MNNNLTINQSGISDTDNSAERLSLARLFKGEPYLVIKDYSLEQLSHVLDSRARRCIKRGFVQKYQRTYTNILRRAAQGIKNKTHARNLMILPSMVGLAISVHNGKDFVPMVVLEEMLGRKLGEFVATKKIAKHTGKKGIGATKGSALKK